MKFPKNITAKELMKVDYHYSYSEEELKKDWSRLKDTTEYKTGAPNPFRTKRLKFLTKCSELSTMSTVTEKENHNGTSYQGRQGYL